jgi:hypothetical protein
MMMESAGEASKLSFLLGRLPPLCYHCCLWLPGATTLFSFTPTAHTTNQAITGA